MFEDLCKIINCCQPRMNLGKYVIKGKLDQNEMTEINDTQKSKNNITGTSPKKVSESIITFSNLKVSQNNTNKRVLDTLVIGGRELLLEGEMFFNKAIIIDKLGIKNEVRTERKWLTIFGISDEANDINSGIDFYLNVSKKKFKGKKDKNIPLFKIEYIKNDDNYMISLLNKDIKMLMYIENEFLIENNTSLDFMVGKVSIIISGPNNNDNMFSVEVEGKTYKYNKLNDCPVSIGRNNTHIIIKNSSISKNHALICYNKDADCISLKDNGSTNGTFFVIGNNLPFVYILSDLTFKLFESKFTIKLIEN